MPLSDILEIPSGFQANFWDPPLPAFSAVVQTSVLNTSFLEDTE